MAAARPQLVPILRTGQYIAKRDILLWSVRANSSVLDSDYSPVRSYAIYSITVSLHRISIQEKIYASNSVDVYSILSPENENEGDGFPLKT